MNILSNILKIDYSLYIIHDKTIKTNIIEKFLCFLYDYGHNYGLNYKNKYINDDLITIIKYNNIYYFNYYYETKQLSTINKFIDNEEFSILIYYNTQYLINNKINSGCYYKKSNNLNYLEIKIYEDDNYTIKKIYTYYKNNTYSYSYRNSNYSNFYYIKSYNKNHNKKN